MTTLTLDPTQRLNIIAGLDRIESVGRREAWAICSLQKMLDLNDDERAMIGWRKLQDDKGREYAMWSSNGDATPRYYDLEDEDVQRICKAMDKYPVILARDRQWWEPLAAQLTPFGDEQFQTPNGAASGNSAVPA